MLRRNLLLALIAVGLLGAACVPVGSYDFTINAHKFTGRRCFHLWYDARR